MMMMMMMKMKMKKPINININQIKSTSINICQHQIQSTPLIQLSYTEAINQLMMR